MRWFTLPQLISRSPAHMLILPLLKSEWHIAQNPVML